MFRIQAIPRLVKRSPVFRKSQLLHHPNNKTTIRATMNRIHTKRIGIRTLHGVKRLQLLPRWSPIPVGMIHQLHHGATAVTSTLPGIKANRTWRTARAETKATKRIIKQPSTYRNRKRAMTKRKWSANRLAMPIIINRRNSRRRIL